MNRVITIGREFGSGGREIGLLLSKKLNIPFYDKELITLSAEAGNLSPEFVESNEEGTDKLTKKGMSRMGYASFMYKPDLSDGIFMHQCDVIKKLASEGPCVIVGRASDFILKDMGSINVFIAASMPYKIARKRAMAPEKKDFSDSDFEKWINDTNRARKEYYEHYTNKSWGHSGDYHLCIHSDLVGIDGSVNTIIAYLNEIEK